MGDGTKRIRARGAAGACAVAALASCLACSARSETQPAPPQARPSGLEITAAGRKFLVVEAIGGGPEGLGPPLPGRVAFRPDAVAGVGSPLPARVASVRVRPGEIVRAGAPLLVLQSADAASARAASDEAAARSAAAEDLLRRQEEMVERGIGLEVERFAAETAAREARAELERARRAVSLIGEGEGDHFTIRSPMDGVVLSVRASLAAVVAPGGEPLVEIGDPRGLWVLADVPETDVGRVARGEAASVLVPDVDARFEATVDGVGRVVEGEQRRVPVYVALRGACERLTPGMLAEVRLRHDGEAPLTLPATAVLVKDGTQAVVYVERADGRFEARPVRTGGSRDGRVEIVEGLAAGERVVVKGALLLDGEAEQVL